MRQKTEDKIFAVLQENFEIKGKIRLDEKMFIGDGKETIISSETVWLVGKGNYKGLNNEEGMREFIYDRFGNNDNVNKIINEFIG